MGTSCAAVRRQGAGPKDAALGAVPVSLTRGLAAWTLVTQGAIIAIQALAAVAFAASVATAQLALRADTVICVPTALACSACAVGMTVTHPALAAAKTSTEDALMPLAASIITLAKTPRALASARAASTLASPLPTAQGSCPIGGPAARFQVQRGELSLRALTEPSKAARGAPAHSALQVPLALTAVRSPGLGVAAVAVTQGVQFHSQLL